MIDSLEIPNYSLAEAARYFHIPPATVSYWASGPKPMVTLASEGPRMLSFKNLVEFYVLEGLRHIHGLKLPSIRKGIRNLTALIQCEPSRHPLADYELRTLHGRDLVFVVEGNVINLTRYGQYEIPEWTIPYLRRVERDPRGLAQKIFPFTNKTQIQAKAEPPRTIVIDPNICFGLPVLAGSRITTGFLASRYRGGDRPADIARSYGRPLAEIKEAIEWETGRKIRQAA